MNFYKFFVCILIVFFSFSFNHFVWADDEIFEDEINILDYIESSFEIVTEPIINSVV